MPCWDHAKQPLLCSSKHSRGFFILFEMMMGLLLDHLQYYVFLLFVLLNTVKTGRNEAKVCILRYLLQKGRSSGVKTNQ